MINSDLWASNIHPMEPISIDEVREDADFFYQVKWDGVRIIAYVDENRVKLINKHYHDRTAQYPELQGLTAALRTRAIIDGEIVVIQKGQPHFPSVMRRDQCRSNKRIEHLCQSLPVDYMVFDLLAYDDRDVRSLPLTDRQALLNQTLPGSERYHIVENFTDGSLLFQAVKAREMEGIVGKRKSSLYTPGKRHHDWYKIKNRLHLDCIIGGYTMRDRQVNALLLGIYCADRLIYIGKAGSGLSAGQWEMLSRELPQIQITYSPFHDLNGNILAFSCYFVNPFLEVQVDFAEWTDNMHLRSPVIKKIMLENKPDNKKLM